MLLRSVVYEDLSENAFKTYVYLITRKDHCAGPREVQRALGFSSPSSALFHLNKLVERGLVREERGIYYINDIKKIGPLRNFFIIRNKLIPKDLIYFLIIFEFTIFDTFVLLNPDEIIEFLALFPLFAAMVLFLINGFHELLLRRKITKFFVMKKK